MSSARQEFCRHIIRELAEDTDTVGLSAVSADQAEKSQPEFDVCASMRLI